MSKVTAQVAGAIGGAFVALWLVGFAVVTGVIYGVVSLGEAVGLYDFDITLAQAAVGALAVSAYRMLFK